MPRLTVLQELTAGSLVGIPLEGLNLPRRIFMVYRNRGYISDSAQQFIDVMGQFNWDDCLPHQERPAAAAFPALQPVRNVRTMS